MRVVIQRVKEASVTTIEKKAGPRVDRQITGKIGPGLLVLAGFEESDSTADLDWMAGKIVRLRVFADENGVMNRSVQEAGGEILAVSQPLFERFVARLSAELGRPVPTGVFGADMQVSLINDGPVTLSIDSRAPD